jgi:hypothetical protein
MDLSNPIIQVILVLLLVGLLVWWFKFRPQSY